MKNLFAILFFLIVLSTNGQNQNPNKLGIGFAIASNPFLYEDMMSHYDKFYKDKGLKVKLEGKKIFPFFYKPDYGLYHFICLEKTVNYYKVLINDKEIGYIANNTDFYFKSWDIMLMNASVERLTDNNPVRVDCSEQSEIVPYNCENDGFIVKDIVEKNNEFWLFVQFSTNCKEDFIISKKNKQGWIKWRIKDKLLVYIYLLC